MEAQIFLLHTQLLVYAREQGVLTDWDGTDIGYTWNISPGSAAQLSSIIIIFIPLALLMFLALFTTLHGVVNNTHSKSVFTFLCSLEIPALLILVVEFITSLILFAGCQTFSCLIKAATPIFVITFEVIFTMYVAKVNNDEPLGTIHFVKYFLYNHVFLKGLIILASISVIPLILLVIVYPAKILSTIIISLSAITMIAVVPSLLVKAITSDVSTDVVSESRRLKKQKVAVVLLVFYTISLIAMVISLLYWKVHEAGATSNVIVFLISTLIPSGLVYGTGKAFRMCFRTVKKICTDDIVYRITPSATNKQLVQLEGQYTVIQPPIQPPEPPPHANPLNLHTTSNTTP